MFAENLFRLHSLIAKANCRENPGFVENDLAAVVRQSPQQPIPSSSSHCFYSDLISTVLFIHIVVKNSVLSSDIRYLNGSRVSYITGH